MYALDAVWVGENFSDVSVETLPLATLGFALGRSIRSHHIPVCKEVLLHRIALGTGGALDFGVSVVEEVESQKRDPPRRIRLNFGDLRTRFCIRNDSTAQS